jgi:hypothetical protein
MFHGTTALITVGFDVAIVLRTKTAIQKLDGYEVTSFSIAN